MTAVAGRGAEVPVDRSGAMLFGRDGFDESVGDFGERLLPGDPLPLAFPALADSLERRGESRPVVHAVAVAGPFLTAARVEIGEIGVGLLVAGDLLLAPDDAVLHIDVPGAALIAAVGVVGALGHAIPCPLLPVEIPEAGVLDRAGCLSNRIRAHLHRPVAFTAAEMEEGERHSTASRHYETSTCQLSIHDFLRPPPRIRVW